MTGKFLCPRCFELQSLDSIEYICSNTSTASKCQHAIDRMDRKLAAFFISGDKDPVGEMGKGVERSAAAFRKAGLTDVTVKLYHDLRHEILNEKTRRFVYQDVLDWLEGHL